ncbi:MAG: hypothetical protein IAE97_02335 [Chthoniobacterales bacterium]|nr:hypothetical protein [Chthoniobacterales bacterium]
MRVCFKYARVFWAVFILLMAGGGAVHAYEDFSCATRHASEHQASASQQSDCASSHTCCHSHSHLPVALAEAPNFVFAALTSGFSFDLKDFPAEGPVREIDHPPQLS